MDRNHEQWIGDQLHSLLGMPTLTRRETKRMRQHLLSRLPACFRHNFVFDSFLPVTSPVSGKFDTTATQEKVCDVGYSQSAIVTFVLALAKRSQSSSALAASLISEVRVCRKMYFGYTTLC